MRGDVVTHEWCRQAAPAGHAHSCEFARRSGGWSRTIVAWINGSRADSAQRRDAGVPDRGPSGQREPAAPVGSTRTSGTSVPSPQRGLCPGPRSARGGRSRPHRRSRDCNRHPRGPACPLATHPTVRPAFVKRVSIIGPESTEPRWHRRLRKSPERSGSRAGEMLEPLTDRLEWAEIRCRRTVTPIAS